MKTITILSLLLFLSFSPQPEKVTFDKCMVTLTKQRLFDDFIELHCASFADNEKFTIKDFSIKFPGFPAVAVEGRALNETAILYAQNLKSNQMVSISKIKNAYLNGKLISAKEIPSFYVKIIEPQVATAD